MLCFALPRSKTPFYISIYFNVNRQDLTFIETIRKNYSCSLMDYALIALQREEKQLQRILIDPLLSENEQNVIRHLIDCIRMQIEEEILVAA